MQYCNKFLTSGEMDYLFMIIPRSICKCTNEGIIEIRPYLSIKRQV